MGTSGGNTWSDWKKIINLELTVRNIVPATVVDDHRKVTRFGMRKQPEGRRQTGLSEFKLTGNHP